jgi:hypothetical protein
MTQITGSISLDTGKLIESTTARVLDELAPLLAALTRSAGGTAVPAGDVPVVLAAHLPSPLPEGATSYETGAYLAERLVRAGYALVRVPADAEPESARPVSREARADAWFDPSRTD